ncbi:MAG: formyltetrahydrofolate deformylase [Salinisphaera sp.]|uniref:formyltetrahydrofolate deformylase n=1 Tax=Salinisphaera sp. TaxID=1914330 RepID=UPI003C7B90D3
MSTVASPEHADSRFVLTATGPSTRGQVAAISRFVDDESGYIEEFDQFDDPSTRCFFARAVFWSAHSPDAAVALTNKFRNEAEDFRLSAEIRSGYDRPRVLILVSRPDHCLRDLLYRRARGELEMEITAVVSNHRDLAPLAEQYGVRFVHLPVSPETRGQQERQLAALIEETGSELVILARYMQILSDDFARRLQGRAINIHHSFLPGFKGARPYRQAYERGVKLIGATAHFVTPDLDEGPIIEQAVERVTHAGTPNALASSGRDCECRALAHAVRCYIERRVFLNGDRTVVF